MLLQLSWPDISLRLALTILAGALMGYDRERQGHSAGLRTTILICFSAALAMIEANLLLPTSGKTSQSFVSMDVIRFPLGILSGVGFIGAGAILKRGDLVVGITTAALLWTATVIGLCFGAGFLLLGTAATLITTLILWGMRWYEKMVPCRQKVLLTVGTRGDPAELLRLPEKLAAFPGARAKLQGYTSDASGTRVQHELHWHGKKRTAPPVELMALIRTIPDLTVLSWKI